MRMLYWNKTINWVESVWNFWKCDVCSKENQRNYQEQERQLTVQNQEWHSIDWIFQHSVFQQSQFWYLWYFPLLHLHLTLTRRINRVNWESKIRKIEQLNNLLNEMWEMTYNFFKSQFSELFCESIKQIDNSNSMSCRNGKWCP